MGLLSRAARRAAAILATPEERLALNYDLALERGVNRQARDAVLRGPRFKEWGMYADEAGGMGPVYSGGRRSVYLGQPPQSDSMVFAHHSHPMTQAAADEGLPNALSPSDFIVQMRDGQDGSFAHEALMGAPHWGGSFSQLRKRELSLPEIPHVQQMHERATASLVAAGVPKRQASMLALISTGRALERLGYIQDYGYRASRPAQSAALRQWREAIRQAESVARESMSPVYAYPAWAPTAAAASAGALGGGGLLSLALAQR